jgi:hypothetical protein
MPLPLEFKLLSVTVWSVVTEPSVHPEVGGPERWVVIAALVVAVPGEFKLKVTSLLTRPHPVFPMRVACHGPVRSAFRMLSMLARLNFRAEAMVVRVSRQTQ